MDLNKYGFKTDAHTREEWIDFLDKNGVIVLDDYDRGNKEFHWKLWTEWLGDGISYPDQAIFSTTGSKNRAEAQWSGIEKGLDLLANHLNNV